EMSRCGDAYILQPEWQASQLGFHRHVRAGFHQAGPNDLRLRRLSRKLQYRRKCLGRPRIDMSRSELVGPIRMLTEHDSEESHNRRIAVPAHGHLLTSFKKAEQALGPRIFVIVGE